MSDDFNKKPTGEGADGWVDEVDPYARTEFGLGAVEGPPTQPPQPPQPPQPHPQQPQPAQPQQQQQLGPARSTQLAPPPHKDPYDVDDGKAMALLAHAGILIGLPTFFIPMLQRDNEFALHHAKAAAVNYIFFFVLMMVVVFTCGLAFFLIPVPYLPMIVGMVKAANGERAGGWAWGGAGERMFGNLTVKGDERHLLE